MEKIGEILNKIYKSTEKERALIENIKISLSPQERKKVKKIKIYKDKIFFYLPSGMECYEWRLKKEKTLKKLRKRLKGVKEIEFKLGE